MLATRSTCSIRWRGRSLGRQLDVDRDPSVPVTGRPDASAVRPTDKGPLLVTEVHKGLHGEARCAARASPRAQKELLARHWKINEAFFIAAER